MSATHRTKEVRLNEADAYYTQPGLARACLAQLVRDGWVRAPECTTMLEPSCGAFAWVNAAIDMGFKPGLITANDINLKWPSDDPVLQSLVAQGMQVACHDFTKTNAFRYQDLICGNPPYNDIMAHLEVSFESLSSMGIVAYLLPIGWFTAAGQTGGRRSERTRQVWLANEGRLAHVYLATPRPKFREGPGTDSASYALAVWAPGAYRGTGFSILDWYDEREKDIARAKELKQAGVSSQLRDDPEMCANPSD